MKDYINKLYTIKELQPGMRLGKEVLTESGQVMLSKGLLLTESNIEGLECWDIDSVFIQEEVSKEPEAADDVPAKVDTPLSKSQQEFCGTYDATIHSIKKLFGSMRYFKEAPLQEMKELSNQSIFPMLDSIGIINNLHMVRGQSEYIFQHSVNVAVMCGILGKWLGYTGVDLADLVLAGLLHDIGKTQISLDILDKPDKLSKEEMAIVQTHAVLGYKLIKDNKDLSPNVIYAVLQHHERMDGSGYPLKAKADKVHQYARIIAIADTYDAMTSDRVYHNKVTPFVVVETMIEEMYNRLDPTICTVFLNNVRNYLIGNTIKLSDGRKAEVVYLGQAIATRPTVCTEDGEFIDLERHKNIGILELMEA